MIKDSAMTARPHAALSQHLRDAIMRNALAYHKDMPDLMSVS